MFNKLKKLIKSKYYTDIFAMNVSNVKRTWQILREVLNRQPNHNKQNEIFVIGNIETNNKKDIANGFNTFFASIGKTISDQITQPQKVYSEFLYGNYPVNFFLQPTYQEELMKVAKNLKTKSSQGFDNLSTFIIQKNTERSSHFSTTGLLRCDHWVRHSQQLYKKIDCVTSNQDFNSTT